MQTRFLYENDLTDRRHADLARHAKPIVKTNSHNESLEKICEQQNHSVSHTSDLDYREDIKYNVNRANIVVSQEEPVAKFTYFREIIVI